MEGQERYVRGVCLLQLLGGVLVAAGQHGQAPVLVPLESTPHMRSCSHDGQKGILLESCRRLRLSSHEHQHLRRLQQPQKCARSARLKLHQYCISCRSLKQASTLDSIVWLCYVCSSDDAASDAGEADAAAILSHEVACSPSASRCTAMQGGSADIKLEK